MDGCTLVPSIYIKLVGKCDICSLSNVILGKWKQPDSQTLLPCLRFLLGHSFFLSLLHGIQIDTLMSPIDYQIPLSPTNDMRSIQYHTQILKSFNTATEMDNNISIPVGLCEELYCVHSCHCVLNLMIAAV